MGKMSSNVKRKAGLVLGVASGIAVAMIPELAFADTQSIGDVAMQASKSINGVQVMIQGACYMAGVSYKLDMYTPGQKNFHGFNRN